MVNQTMMQYFEWFLPADGLLWQRLAAQAQELKKVGFDLLWLPPAYKGAAGSNDVGYGVYDTYDLGEFQQKGSISTKYGTREEYLTALAVLRKHQMRALVDIVLNHRMGADETEMVEASKFAWDDRTHQISEDQLISAWTKFTFPGRKNKYSSFHWDHSCFTAIDWDEKSKQNAIFQLEGKEWSQDVDKEKGNFDYLMGADVDFDNPLVVEELHKWGRWYIATTQADGLRLDALKHIDYAFFETWLDAMRDESDKELFTVGEYWSSNLDELTTYLNNCNRRMSLFDVPLHMNFFHASQGNGYYDMGSILNGTLACTDSAHAVTFVDNHDTQPGQSLESWVQEWFKPLAYALILLREAGLPCVFYADYYGLRNDGVPAVPGLKQMVAIRRRYAYGPQTDYFDHQDIVGFTRQGDSEHPHSGIAVMMSDGAGGQKTMCMGKQNAGQVMTDVLRRVPEKVIIDAQGNGLFTASAGAVSVYLFSDAYEHIVVHYE